MSSCWLFYNTITCLLCTTFSLSSDTITSLDHVLILVDQILVFTAIKSSVCSDVSLSFPSQKLNILKKKKFWLYKILHTILENLISWSGLAKWVWKGSRQKRWRGQYHFSQLLLFLLTPLLLRWSWQLNKIMLQKCIFHNQKVYFSH